MILNDNIHSKYFNNHKKKDILLNEQNIIFIVKKLNSITMILSIIQFYTNFSSCPTCVLYSCVNLIKDPNFRFQIFLVFLIYNLSLPFCFLPPSLFFWSSITGQVCQVQASCFVKCSTIQTCSFSYDQFQVKCFAGIRYSCRWYCMLSVTEDT